MTARLIEAVMPGDPAWLTYMTASKISAVVGLSPYESPFSLWHRMAGNIPPEPDNDLTRRGHYLEPAIRAWFADQHPELHVSTTGTWVHEDRGWQAASPDALLHHVDLGVTEQPVACAEFKTAHEDDDWGEPGSDEIPIYYRCQVMWQMDVLGLRTCHVAALTRHIEFAEYLVEWDETEAALLRHSAELFMTSLDRGEPPDLDEHGSTYRAVRQLHPDIDDVDVQLPDHLVEEFCTARARLDAAEMGEQLARTRIAAAMGNARRGRWRHRTIAFRQAKSGGTPYVVAARRLPSSFPNPKVA